VRERARRALAALERHSSRLSPAAPAQSGEARENAPLSASGAAPASRYAVLIVTARSSRPSWSQSAGAGLRAELRDQAARRAARPRRHGDGSVAFVASGAANHRTWVAVDVARGVSAAA
jgi:hypothetical protein